MADDEYKVTACDILLEYCTGHKLLKVTARGVLIEMSSTNYLVGRKNLPTDVTFYRPNY